MSIYILNEYCLQHIFSYFTMYELIDLEDVCPLFKYIAEIKYSKIKALTLDYRTIEVDKLEAIFDRIGHHLKKFEFSAGYIMSENIKLMVVNGLSNECSTSLTNLKLNYMQLSDVHMTLLLPVFHNLTHLDLSRCNLSNEINTHFTKKKFDCKKLRHLNVGGNSMITGEFLVDLIYLSTLDISYCFNLDYFFFGKFLKKCLLLKSLNVSGCGTLMEGNLINDILHFQPNLVELYANDLGIENNNLFEVFPYLKIFQNRTSLYVIRG